MHKALSASAAEAGIVDTAGLSGQPGAFAHYRWWRRAAMIGTMIGKKSHGGR